MLKGREHDLRTNEVKVLNLSITSNIVSTSLTDCPAAKQRMFPDQGSDNL